MLILHPDALSSAVLNLPQENKYFELKICDDPSKYTDRELKGEWALRYMNWVHDLVRLRANGVNTYLKMPKGVFQEHFNDIEDVFLANCLISFTNEYYYEWKSRYVVIPDWDVVTGVVKLTQPGLSTKALNHEVKNKMEVVFKCDVDVLYSKFLIFENRNGYNTKLPDFHSCKVPFEMPTDPPYQMTPHFPLKSMNVLVREARRR